MGFPQRATDFFRRRGRSAALCVLVLAAVPAWAAPAELVSHVPGSPATAGDAGLGSNTIEIEEGFFLNVPIRFYAMAAQSGDVAFSSAAGNLVVGQVDDNGAEQDVYHWNRATGTITLVSHADGSATSTCNGGRSLVSPGGISADGRYVVYTSTCGDLDATLDSDADGSAYLWDRDTDTNVLLSVEEVSPGVFQALPGLYPAISADGSTIWYRGEDPFSATPAGYLVDRATLVRTLVTHEAGGAAVAAATSMDPRSRAISADGSYVVYASNATDLVAGQIADGDENLFLYDRVTDTSQMVTHAAGNPLQPAFADGPRFRGGEIALSADGSRLAYASPAQDLIAGFIDGNGPSSDVYVYTRASGTSQLVSHRPDNPLQGGNGFCLHPTINADGTRVAYASGAGDLLAGQVVVGAAAVFLWDAVSNVNRMVSHDAASATTDGGGASLVPAIDDSGTRVAYASTGSGMIAGMIDVSGVDIFHWTEAADLTRLVSRNATSALTTDNGTDALNPVAPDFPLMDAGGTLVLFPSDGTDLTPGQNDLNGGADLFLFEITQPTVSFAVAADSVAENAALASIAVLLSEPAEVDVTVPFTIGGSAVAPDDYSVTTPSPLTIPAGSTVAAIELALVDDALDEADETVIFTLGAPVNATLGAPFVHTLTIVDNDDPPELRFAVAASSVAEGANANVEVQLSAASGLDVSVAFGVSGGSASDPDDYSLLTATPLTIPAGSTSATILVGTVADGIAEPDETLVLTLSAPVNATLTAPTDHTLTIIDGDPPPEVRFAVAASGAGEAAGNASVTVELSALSAFDVTVSFAASGSATSPDDYGITTASPLTIPAGSLSATIDLTLVDDALDEADETVILTLSGPSNATLGAPSVHTLTIVDNDDPPELRFAVAGSSVTEGNAAAIAVELSAVSGQDVSVAFDVTGGSATSPGDYSVTTSSPLTIPAGSTAATITLSTVLDGINEPDETVELSLSAPVNATLGAPASHTLTIVDNDAPPSVGFTTASSSVGEGGSAVLTVTLSAVSAFDITVPYSVGGSASDPADYSIAPASPLVIPAGGTAASLTITTVADALDEADETVIVTLGAPVNAMLGAPSSHTLTIVDANDPMVRFAAAASGASESAGVVGVVVELSVASVFDVSVPFTISGSAVESEDYSVTTVSPITIPAGSTTAAISLALIDDALNEPDETVVLTLGAPTNATLGAPSVHTLTIIDNDDPPTLRFDADASSVGEGGRALVALRLSAPSGYDISAPFSVGGSATPDEDYVIATPSPITIAAGTTSAFIDIDTLADDLFEGTEELLLTLGTPVNATLGAPSSHTLSIVEFAPPPTLRFDASASAVGEGGAAQIGVTLSAPIAEPVQVGWSVSGGSATPGEDYTPVAGTLTILPGETTAVIVVNALADGLAEGDETAVLALGTPTNATLAAPAEHTLTIVDGDPLPQASFELATLRLPEGESALLTVNLSAPAARDFIVPFTLGGDATRDADYAIDDSPLVIPAGSTQANLLVVAFDDGIAEGDETLTITLQDGTLAKASQTIVITLVDAAPRVNFINTQVFLTEGFETDIIVELEAPLDEDALVAFEVDSVHGEPGASADDYVIAGSPIVIPAGQTRGVIRFLALPDQQVEVDECLLIRLQVSVNSVPGPRAEILVVIRNEGGTPERGGGAFGAGMLLLFAATLALGRRRMLFGASLIALAQAAQATPPQLVYPDGRNWLRVGDDFVLRAGLPAEGETLLLELDAIDVTGLMQRDASGALILRPATPLAPGPHRLRLLRQTEADELVELGVWDIDLRRSESLRSTHLGYAAALQGNAPVASSEDIDKYSDYTANASVRVDLQADTGAIVYDGQANVLTDSNALRTGQDKVQLGDFRFGASDGELQLTGGHHAVAPVGGQAQGNFAYDGGSRRGLSLSSKLPFMSATATAYAMAAEPVLGFRNGLGFSRPGSRFTGGMFQALPWAGERGQVGLTMHYIEGRSRNGGSSVFSADDNLFIPVSGVDGSVGNAVLDTRWLDGALSLRAEYARSERNFPTVFGIALAPATDDAQSYVLSYQTREGLRIGEHALTGSITFDHQVIGSAFRSVAAPGGSVDLAQDRISAGLQYRTLSLDLSAARSEDNVGNAPFPTTRADNLGAQLSWSPEIAPEKLPSFLQQPSLSLGAGTDHRKTVRLPDGDLSAPTDAENRNLTVMLSFVQPLGGWSLSYGRSGSDDNTGQSQGFRGDTGSADASFQLGSRVSLTAQVYTDLSRQLDLVSAPDAEFPFFFPGNSQRSLSGTLGLQWLVTDRWNMSFGYSSNRARAGDGTQETRGQQFDLNSSWALGSLSLFLRGSWQQASDRMLIQPWEDEFGEIPPPEYERSRRETYQAFAGFSYNFSGPQP